MSFRAPCAHEALFQLRQLFTSIPGTGVISIHRGNPLTQNATAYVDLPDIDALPVANQASFASAGLRQRLALSLTCYLSVKSYEMLSQI